MISGPSTPFISFLLKNNQMYRSRSSSCSLECFHRPSLHSTVFNLFIYTLNFSIYFFRWKLNGTEISPKSGSHYSLSGGNLRISHLNKDQDAGTYQCLASNSFGTIVSREASLTFACESLFFSLSLSLSGQTFVASELPLKKRCSRKKDTPVAIRDNIVGSAW